MSSTLDQTPHPHESQTVAVKRGERTWPPQTTTHKSRSSANVRELSDHEIATNLPALVARDLKALLPFYSIGDNSAVAGTVVVAAYVSSLDTLKQFRHEAEFLIEAVCHSHIEFEQVAGSTDDNQRVQSERSLLRSMLGRADMKLPVAQNRATADLLAGPVDELFRQLRHDLDRAVNIFTESLFALFDHLVDVSLTGLFEWSGESTCRYHFFKEIVRQENAGTKRQASDRLISGVDENGEQIRIRRTTITDKTTGADTLRIARHEHHVMHAFQTSLENTKVVQPLAVQQMVKAIPAWLAPHIAVIDGVLFREQIISRDYRTDDWTQTRVSTVDEPVLGCEPAILIGQVVLAGWGPTEIAAELERREQEERENRHFAIEAGAPELLSPCLHLLAVLLMVVACVASAPLMMVSVLCLIGGLWSGIASRAAIQQQREVAVTTFRNAGQAGATFLFVAAIQSFIVAGYLWNGGAASTGVGCFAAAVIISSFFGDE